MRGEPQIGTDFGNYRLAELLSRGGMGVVYLAEDVRMGRTVALKLISAEYAQNDAFRARFLHESRVAGAINHPNVIPVYDAGEHDGLLYIAMRYVEGTDLRGLLNSSAPLELERTVAIVSQSAAALAETHSRGLIHRDVKPANILLVPRRTEDGTDHVYLSDFGLAKHLGSLSGPTRTGQFMGTVGYVSPEQIRGKGVEHRTDVYALGCVLFECLTGAPPFPRKDDFATIMAHVNDAPPLVCELRPDTPAALEDVVQRALAKAPEDRFDDCDQMGVALRRAVGRSGTTPLPVPPPVPAPRVLARRGEGLLAWLGLVRRRCREVGRRRAGASPSARPWRDRRSTTRSRMDPSWARRRRQSRHRRRRPRGARPGRPAQACAASRSARACCSV